MSKPKKEPKFNIADTNLALFGTEIEKKCKEAAAGHEPAWQACGKGPATTVWRIEKFNVVAWAKPGVFHKGDSYIVLWSRKKPDSDGLLHDVQHSIQKKNLTIYAFCAIEIFFSSPLE